MWAVVEGLRSGSGRRYSAAVYERSRDAGWRSLPALPESTGSSYRLDIAGLGSRPCVKYTRTRDRGEVIRCLAGGRWKRLRRAGSLPPASRLVEMQSYAGALTVLAETGRGFRVLQFDKQRWLFLGGLLRAARASLGTEVVGADRRPAVGVLRSAAGGGPRGRPVERVPHVLRRGHWVAQKPLRGLASGPSVSGPLVLGARTLMAHTQVRGARWPFGVSVLDGQAWRQVGGTSLSDSAGASQGVLDLADGAAWALWQDNVPTAQGFDTTISLARVDPSDPQRPRVLWHGLSNGPGSLQVLDALGGSWVVYMPSRAGGQGRREVVVQPLGG